MTTCKNNSIGLLTFHRPLNFGAALQAFALQQTILSLGYSCKIIDLAVIFNYGNYRLFRFSPRLINIKRNLRAVRYLRSEIILRSRFEKFRSNHLQLTQRFSSPSEMKPLVSTFDSFVTGSDQVWNPKMVIKEYRDSFFLDFVSSQPRIAYAPSFGSATFCGEERAKVAKHLKSFDFLSAREESGCRLIEVLSGRKARHVLDPTLLLPISEYDKVCTAVRPFTNYILLYPMEVSEELKQSVMQLRKLLEMPIVALVPVYFSPLAFSFADRVIFDAGPLEFLSLFKNASFICTNSFHGVAFSLKFKKDFISIRNTLANDRSYDLLERVGLLARQPPVSRQILLGDELLRTIDYSLVDVLMEKAVAESRDYLKEAMSGRNSLSFGKQ